jgi:MFS family permease
MSADPIAAPATISETSFSYSGWRVVFVCFVMATFAWGMGFYGHGVYLAELERLHGWTASMIATASSGYYLLGAVLMAFVSDFIRRFGPRRLVLAGVAFLAASTALVGQLDNLGQLYLVYALMAVGWAGTGIAAVTTIVGLWFAQRRGLAISIALTGASCGGIVITPALVAATEQFGFSATMLGAAVVMIGILLPFAVAWIDWPPEGSAAAAQAGARDGAAGMTRKQALRTFKFWTVAAPFALALVAQVGFLVHQIAFLEPAVGRMQAGFAVAVTTSMAVIGRLVVGAVVDRLDQRMTSAILFTSQAAAIVMMMRATDPVLIYLACAIFGFSVGNIITLPALIIQHEFPPASFGMLIGLSTAVFQFTFAFAPSILGLLHDAAAGYATPLWFCAALEIAAAAAVLVRSGGHRGA